MSDRNDVVPAPNVTSKITFEHVVIVTSQILVTSIGLGLYARSWNAVGVMFVALSLMMIRQTSRRIGVILLSVGWGVTGIVIGRMFGSIGVGAIASIVLAGASAIINDVKLGSITSFEEVGYDV